MDGNETLQVAQRLIKTLGGSAREQATQNALDRYEAHDQEAARFWLDVRDIVAAAQANSAVSADDLRSAPFLVQEAVTLSERTRKLGLE